MAPLYKPPIDIDSLADSAVREITSLLSFDPDAHTSRSETNDWLREQGKQVHRLRNKELLRSDSLLRRGYAKVFSYPTLCHAHKQLDRHTIRGLLWNVAYECTARTNVYRILRNKERFKAEVEQQQQPPGTTKEQLELVDKHEEDLNRKLSSWLDRIDEITALWLGESRYRSAFRSRKRGFLPLCSETSCDACMLAAVGGDPKSLVALRTSLLARYSYEVKKARGKKQVDDPPLLRVVDAWLANLKHDDDATAEFGEEIAPILMGMREFARALEHEKNKRRRKEGKHPKRRRAPDKVQWTIDKLPCPFEHEPRTSKHDRVFKTRLTRKGLDKMASEEEEEDGSSSSSFSVKMSGGIQTEESDGDKGESKAPSKEELSAIRDGIAPTPRARTIDLKDTYDLTDFHNRHEKSPSPSDPAPPQSSSAPSTTTDPQDTSSSSWTSAVIEEEEEEEEDDDDDDDNYDDDRRPAGMKLSPYDDNDGIEIVEVGDNEAECSTSEPHLVPPEASSVYSCDQREKETTTTIPGISLEVSSVHSCDEDEKEKEEDHDDSKALEKWRGSDGAASCFESMGWGAPKKP